jgi:AcrR family transcriptional regulator
MPRITKEEDYSVRRNEILDAAQRLVYSKGYESMTIQDILNAVEISKGAFYHYFPSKHALLEGLIDRSIVQATNIVAPVLEDPELSSLEKLTRYFDKISSWKISQKAYMIQLLRVWYLDENSLLRHKMATAGIEFLSPILINLINQGIAEGTMKVVDPQTTAKVVYSLMISLGENLGNVILSSDQPGSKQSILESIKTMLDTTQAYTKAIERVLGVQEGSIILVSDTVLKEWIAT